jgi:hypothetical protein
VALAELDSRIPTGKICPSHTMSTGVGRADRHFTERVDRQAGMKEKRFHCGHAPQGLGVVETLQHNGNLTDEQALRNPT